MSPQEAELARLSEELARVWQRSGEIFSKLATRPLDNTSLPAADPFKLAETLADASFNLFSDPGRVIEAQQVWWDGYLNIWQNSLRRLTGEPTATPLPHGKPDRRFKDPAWENSTYFNFLKQTYLLTAEWLQDFAQSAQGLDEKAARKLNFCTRQFIDAISPSNFVLSNPEVMRLTIESRGQNLIKGYERFLSDLERGNGQVMIQMTDPNAFTLGETLAITPGEVIYQNELIQLIQYYPATDSVFKRPLLIVPPWINKYYVLDLSPQNSFVKWAVEQGHTVFVISWVNPDARLAAKNFDDYMQEGILASLSVIEQVTGEHEADSIGYCLGGTLLAATLGYMAATGDTRIQSATYFVTLVDFADPGDISVFIDEAQLTALDQQMQKQGYLDAAALYSTFNLLRANDLIWSFVVNNYLLGRDPFPLDLLYWTSDSTRMPAAMHSFYLHQMYEKNFLSQSNGMTLGNVSIDLGKVATPSCFVGCREDHIAPWQSVYKGTNLMSGPAKFILASSGHVAGIINPPSANKYSYWSNQENPTSAELWLENAIDHQGSWWPEWQNWIETLSSEKVPNRNPLSSLEPAPGSYVKLRAL